MNNHRRDFHLAATSGHEHLEEEEVDDQLVADMKDYGSFRACADEQQAFGM